MHSRKRKIDPFTKAGHHLYESIDAFLATPLTNGLHSIGFHGQWLDFLYEEHGAPVTLVSFSAAVPLEHTYPVFSGWSFPRQVPVNLLAFSDPAIGLDPAVRTFWHLGTNRINAPTLARRIIDRISPDSTHTLFFGASAGGYAALMHSAERPGSAVLVLNPRTDLTQPPEVYREAEAPFFDRTAGALIFARGEADLKVTYGRPRGNQVFHLQNLGDAWYLKCQYGPFRDVMAGRAGYHRITGHWGRGHLAPPREAYLPVLRALAVSAPEWDPSR